KNPERHCIVMGKVYQLPYWNKTKAYCIKYIVVL
ncbi:unnamed protein product, partial [Leptidea sinapis]